MDRTNLEEMTKNIEDFTDFFVLKLTDLKRHSFIADQQSSFFNEAKQNLVPGTVLIGGDFSENYHYIVQDAAQGYHWANDQITIHPFIVYYKESDRLLSMSIAMLSDELNHDTVAVYSFQKVLIEYLRDKLKMEKIIYFSDGCLAQYKNKKNFANLVNHKDDFQIPAEWHFFATAHGKGKLFYSY